MDEAAILLSGTVGQKSWPQVPRFLLCLTTIVCSCGIVLCLSDLLPSKFTEHWVTATATTTMTKPLLAMQHQSHDPLLHSYSKSLGRPSAAQRLTRMSDIPSKGVAEDGTPTSSFIFFGSAVLSFSALVAMAMRKRKESNAVSSWAMMSTVSASKEEETELLDHPPAPWRYTGRAYLQLSFMDAAVAKTHLPKGIVLDSSLERFGKTYGGFFLAEYDDTPFGSFWELVVISGLVWNREPTLKDILLGLFTAPSADTDVGQEQNSRSTWASHVFVGSKAARDHGRSIFGLPSNVAQFAVTDADAGPNGEQRQKVVIRHGSNGEGGEIATLYIPKRGRSSSKLPPTGFGPLKLSLPSLSGCSQYVPELLHYSVDLTCKASMVIPQCDVTVPEDSVVTGIMGLSPLICINFDDMVMDVPEPVPYL